MSFAEGVMSAFHRISVRQRLTLTYTALFLGAGAVLLFINYELMSQMPFLASVFFGPPAGAGGAPTTVTQGDVNQIVSNVRDATLHQLLVQSLIALAIMAVVSALLGF